MNAYGPLLLIAVIALVLIVPVELRRRRALQHFWDRHCMGLRWRRRFPDAPKAELREFLRLFVDAFGYNQKRRACFSPEDRVMDVYRAEYPPGSFADCLELETLGMSLERRYGIDFSALWREDITLGELFEHARARIS